MVLHRLVGRRRIASFFAVVPRRVWTHLGWLSSSRRRPRNRCVLSTHLHVSLVCPVTGNHEIRPRSDLDPGDFALGSTSSHFVNELFKWPAQLGQVVGSVSV